jgi:hypothetical protein
LARETVTNTTKLNWVTEKLVWNVRIVVPHKATGWQVGWIMKVRYFPEVAIARKIQKWTLFVTLRPNIKVTQPIKCQFTMKS